MTGLFPLVEQSIVKKPPKISIGTGDISRESAAEPAAVDSGFSLAWLLDIHNFRIEQIYRSRDELLLLHLPRPLSFTDAHGPGDCGSRRFRLIGQLKIKA